MNLFTSLKRVFDAIATKIDKVSGGAGNVAILSGNGSLSDSGVSIAPVSSVAGATELVRGDDTRLGIKGGVYIGTGFAVTPADYFPGSSYTIIAQVTPQAVGADRWLVGFTNSATQSYGSTCVNLHRNIAGSRLSWISRVEPGSAVEIFLEAAGGDLSTSKSYSFALSRDAATGVTTAYIDGVSAGTSSSAAFDFGTTAMRAVLGRDAALSDVSNGAVTDLMLFNRPLSVDEINSCRTGVIPVSLARVATPFDMGTFVQLGGAAVTGASGTGWTQNKAAGIEYVVSSNISVIAGQKYRLIGTQSLFAVNQAYFDGGGNNQANNGISISASGGFSGEITAAATGTTKLTFQTVAGAVNYTVAGLGLAPVGTVEHFPPDTVSSAANWRGLFGGILVATTGVTALHPEPRGVRTEKVRYNLATSTASDPIPAGWTLTYISTGVLKVTPPAWARAVDRPLVTATTDGDSFCSSDYDTDATDIYLRCKTVGTTPTATDAKLRISLEWRE